MDRSDVSGDAEGVPFVGALARVMMLWLMRHQATVPRVNTALPGEPYPPPDLGTAIPECLQVAVDGLATQLQHSVMLQVKSITSLKCVKLSPQMSRSYHILGDTTARRAWQFSSPGVSTLPCWLSWRISTLQTSFFMCKFFYSAEKVYTSRRAHRPTERCFRKPTKAGGEPESEPQEKGET